MQIAIPSKGRAGLMKTAKLLEECGICYHVFVEPQDFDSYEKNRTHYQIIINIEENDRGIVFARNTILEYARQAKWENFWMMDDDLQEFGQVVKGKTVKKNADVIYLAQDQLLRYDISLGSLQLRQFAWGSKELVRNRMAMQCYLFNMKNCQNLNFDPRVKIRDDFDLSLQAIFKAKGTLRTSKYYYGSDDMKSGMPGGMTSIYNEKNEKDDVSFLQKKWPGIFEQIEKRNRIDVKINWSKIPS